MSDKGPYVEGVSIEEMPVTDITPRQYAAQILKQQVPFILIYAQLDEATGGVKLRSVSDIPLDVQLEFVSSYHDTLRKIHGK